VSGVTVVVDFGATDTVAVQRVSGRPPRPVVIDGEATLPSAVLLSAEDQLVVGRAALRIGDREPDRLVTDLKDRLDRRDVMVADIALPVTALVRALLVRALRSAGPADELVLTHPVTWDRARVDTLRRAATGLAPTIRTFDSALAAAADIDLEHDQSLLVVELDGEGGTAAVVRRGAVVSHRDLPADADVGRVADAADAVVLAGRSARVPAAARRLAETGRPVRIDPDPATTVARGALRLLDSDPSPAFIPTSDDDSSGRRRLRRVVVSAAALVIIAAVSGMLALGWGPGLRTEGSPGPAAGALVDDPVPDAEDAMPPALDGQEIVAAGQPAFTTGRLGAPARYRDGRTTLEVAVGGVQATRTERTMGAAPAGYRWLTVRLSGTNAAGPAWQGDFSRNVAVLDDRGLVLSPVGDGTVPCAAGESSRTVAPGQRFSACVVLPVPEQTPVGAVVFGTSGPGAQPPIRVPVSLPAWSREPAAANVVGKVGQPPVEVTLNDQTMRAGFDVVLTPSGYLGDRRPAAGNRFVVVRAALGPPDDVFLRDARGALSRPVPGFDRMPKCPPFAGPGTTERPAYACFVFEIDANAEVVGVTYADMSTGARVSAREIEDWPTWTVD